MKLDMHRLVSLLAARAILLSLVLGCLRFPTASYAQPTGGPSGGGAPSGGGPSSGGPSSSGPSSSGPSSSGAGAGANASSSSSGASNTGEDLPATGIETVGNVILDFRNNSLTIRATPSKHRQIEKVLELLTQDALADKDTRVASFDLLNLTPDQFRQLIRFHKPTLNPNDQRRFHIEEAPEQRGMESLIPKIPSVSSSSGSGAGGGGGGGGGGGSPGGGGGGGGP